MKCHTCPQEWTHGGSRECGSGAGFGRVGEIIGVFDVLVQRVFCLVGFFSLSWRGVWGIRGWLERVGAGVLGA